MYLTSTRHKHLEMVSAFDIRYRRLWNGGHCWGFGPLSKPADNFKIRNDTMKWLLTNDLVDLEWIGFVGGPMRAVITNLGLEVLNHWRTNNGNTKL